MLGYSLVMVENLEKNARLLGSHGNGSQFIANIMLIGVMQGNNKEQLPVALEVVPNSTKVASGKKFIEIYQYEI